MSAGSEISADPAALARRRSSVLVTPVVGWLVVFFVIPVGLLLLKNIAADPLLAASTAATFAIDEFYRPILVNSLVLGTATATGTLLIAYPAAFFLTKIGRTKQKVLMLATFLPLTLSAVVKTFGLAIVFRSNGLVNTFLLNIGLIDQPLRILFTPTALYVGMINVFLPFMLIPLYAAFRGIDPRLYDAALCLGARPFTAFTRVVLPLTMPGVRSGFALVFALAIGAYVTPLLLVGDRFPTLPSTIARGYLYVPNETLAGVASIILLMITVPVMVLVSERGRAK